MTDTAASAARELPLEPGGAVEIHVSSGDLRIAGIDGDRVVVRSRDGEPLGDDITIEAAPGVVRIADGPWNLKLGPLSIRTRRSRDLDIDLPRTARVNLRTLSGEVQAVGVGGASRWASASGDLHIATTAGPVHVETMSGDAILDASAAIDLGARTVSGSLRVRAPRLETTDVGTTSGDVRIEADLAAGASHSISSVSGDVELATGSPVRLDAQTITGDVRAQGPHHADGGRGRRTLVVGNGSVSLSVRTTSGDVRLRVLAGGTPGATPVRPQPPVPPLAPEPPIAPVAPVPPLATEAPLAPEPLIAPLATEPPLPTEPPARASGPTDDPFAAWPADLSPLAEATAGPVAPRGITEEDTQAWSAPAPVVDRREAARLDILRALERGDLDIETASRRLEILEDAGPRSFRGWC